MNDKERKFIERLLTVICLHRGLSTNNICFFTSGNVYVIELKKIFSSLSLVAAVNLHVDILNLISQHGIPFTQQTFTNQKNVVTEIQIKLKINDATRLNQLFSKLWE